MWIRKRIIWEYSFCFLLVLFLPVFIACSGEGGNGSSASVVSDADNDDGYNYPNGPYPDDYYNKTVDYGELVDSRDGQKYRTITIERQTWMAENLSFKPSFGKTECPFPEYNKCGNYGVLYPWAVAVDSAKDGCGFGVYCTEKLPLKGICPDGWHLPSKAEWDIFDKAVMEVMLLDSSRTDSVGFVLKSSEYWHFGLGDSSTSGDRLGFGGLPIVGGIMTYYWSSSEVGRLNSYVSDLNWSGPSLTTWAQYDKSRYGSVRCVKNSELTDSLGGVSGVVKGNEPKIIPCRVNRVDACKYGKLTDSRDGKTYKTVQIGTQNWMAQDLDYKIPTGGSYESNDANYKFLRYYSMFSAREACPSGWHLPDSSEWRTLIDDVGGDSVASVVLKSDTAWKESGTWDNSRGLNSYGFNVLDLGDKSSSDFTEDSLLERGTSQYRSTYWSADDFPEGRPPVMNIWGIFEKVDISHGHSYSYLPIRCIEGNPPRDTAIRTWYGHRGDTTIVTGIESKNNAMNLWYSYTDEADSGKTHIEWPVDTSKKYSVFLPSLIHKCQGICGTVDFDKGNSSKDPYAGIGLYVVGEKTANSGVPAAGDASNWGGLCIAYASDLNAHVRVQLGDSLGYLEYPLESTQINNKNIKWSDFDLVLNNAAEKVNIEEAVKHVVSVNFYLKGISGSSANFTVYSIGGYRGNCADAVYFFN